MAGFGGFYQWLALADFICGCLWRILSVAGFGGFYQWLGGFYQWLPWRILSGAGGILSVAALADFIRGYPNKNIRGVLDRSAFHILSLGNIQPSSDQLIHTEGHIRIHL